MFFVYIKDHIKQKSQFEIVVFDFYNIVISKQQFQIEIQKNLQMTTNYLTQRFVQPVTTDQRQVTVFSLLVFIVFCLIYVI